MNKTAGHATFQELASELVKLDPYLEPYREIIVHRLSLVQETENRLLRSGQIRDLGEFALGHLYYGLHKQKGHWILREWAPGAQAVHFLCAQNNWQCSAEFALQKCNDRGDWELVLPFEFLRHQDLFKLYLTWPGGADYRLPTYARRVIQDQHTLNFNAQVWDPEPYTWQHPLWQRSVEPPLIYEAHVGMAQEKKGIGSYVEFTENILPRIVQAGYNTLQLMGILEHPYYGSFGYQVSNFFAPCSRFGTPEELKALIDTAHGLGLAVLIDLVHSHAASNTVEGPACFDGSNYFFHPDPRGHHPAWGSKCFDYSQIQTMHFLLSNCRYWLDEFNVDGFRFDGITSMIYTHHGLNKAFTSYADYFDPSVDEAALTYLALANKLIHQLKPSAITIAEDVSGMPGLALARPKSIMRTNTPHNPAPKGKQQNAKNAAPYQQGTIELQRAGFGFDFRFAMGIADWWIKIIKEYKDENWPLGLTWHELTNRRRDEQTISYAESHDQALVGDKTLIFRLTGAALYEHMRKDDNDIRIERAMALHKMIRLITLTTAGHGYLNFMGNEFGHPEWIDFPRPGNNWSYKHARRQWSLVDNPDLKYQYLACFDRNMLILAKKNKLLQRQDLKLLTIHEQDQVIAFKRDNLILVFNFNPHQSFTDYPIPAPAGTFKMVLDSDQPEYGGHGRLHPGQTHHSLPSVHGHCLSLYLPTRTGLAIGLCPGIPTGPVSAAQASYQQD